MYYCVLVVDELHIMILALMLASCSCSKTMLLRGGSFLRDMYGLVVEEWNHV